MFTSGHKLKIFHAVIIPDFVDVMDDFTFLEATPNCLFHDQSVLKNSLAAVWSKANNITILICIAFHSIVTRMIFTPCMSLLACLRTKMSFPTAFSAPRHLIFYSAMIASDRHGSCPRTIGTFAFVGTKLPHFASDRRWGRVKFRAAHRARAIQFTTRLFRHSKTCALGRTILPAASTNNRRWCMEVVATVLANTVERWATGFLCTFTRTEFPVSSGDVGGRTPELRTAELACAIREACIIGGHRKFLSACHARTVISGAGHQYFPNYTTKTALAAAERHALSICRHAVLYLA